MRAEYHCSPAEVSAGDDKDETFSRNNPDRNFLPSTKQKCNQHILFEWIWPCASLLNFEILKFPKTSSSLSNAAFDEAITELGTLCHPQTAK